MRAEERGRWDRKCRRAHCAATLENEVVIGYLPMHCGDVSVGCVERLVLRCDGGGAVAARRVMIRRQAYEPQRQCLIVQ